MDTRKVVEVTVVLLVLLIQSISLAENPSIYTDKTGQMFIYNNQGKLEERVYKFGGKDLFYDGTGKYIGYLQNGNFYDKYGKLQSRIGLPLTKSNEKVK